MMRKQRGDEGIAPYERARGAVVRQRGDAPQGYLLRCVGIALYERSIEDAFGNRRSFRGVAFAVSCFYAVSSTRRPSGAATQLS